MAAKCHRTVIAFKTKRGKTVHFSGKTGSGCGPRPKPSTRHLAPWKSAMKRAAPQCKRSAKGNVRAYRKCVGQAMHSIHG